MCEYNFFSIGVLKSLPFLSLSLSQDMIKHSTTTDHKGKQKEYFDQLKVSSSASAVYIPLVATSQYILELMFANPVIGYLGIIRMPLVERDRERGGCLPTRTICLETDNSWTTP